MKKIIRFFRTKKQDDLQKFKQDRKAQFSQKLTGYVIDLDFAADKYLESKPNFTFGAFVDHWKRIGGRIL